MVVDANKLAMMANEARSSAYAPYSGFKVGAALLTADGKIYTGINIENSSYGATVCAERTAAFKAVSEGRNKFVAIAVSGDTKNYLHPCGICRQVLSEFGDKNMKIICCNREGKYKIYTLEEILPYSFTHTDMEE